MVPPDQIAALAELYGRFANALDPFSEDRDLAEELFYLKLNDLKQTYAPSLAENDFRREAVRRYKLFLNKN